MSRGQSNEEHGALRGQTAGGGWHGPPQGSASDGETDIADPLYIMAIYELQVMGDC